MSGEFQSKGPHREDDFFYELQRQHMDELASQSKRSKNRTEDDPFAEPVKKLFGDAADHNISDDEITEETTE